MEQVESAEFASALARISAVLLSQETVATTVQLVTTLAQKTLPGTAGAGVSLVDAAGKRTTAASDPVVEQADRLQYELDEGPCLTAWRDRVTVRIDDADAERRWPRWTHDIADLGIRSVVSAPMVVGDRSIGAVKVYSFQRDTYDERSEELLGLFAQQAAVLLANAQSYQDAQRLTDNLKVALASRDVIGQAKGVLIAGGAGTEEEAFAMLVSASQRSNVKVRDVARQVVDGAVSRAGRSRNGPRPGS